MKGQLTFIAASLLVFTGNASAQLDRSGPPTAANALVRDTAKVEAGGDLFRQRCTGCHGRGGEGGQGEGQGPNLATSWEVRRAKDAELFDFIKHGVKGTAMPAFPLPDEQIWELAAFVRSLNAPADTLPVKGDVAAGEKLFFGKGQCSSCHMIRGRGGYLGPDLSNSGATKRLAELRNALVDPSIEPSANFRPLMIQSANKEELKAVAKHFSYWSANVIDERGQLHLIHGEAARTLQFRNRSWMTAEYARRLSPEELENLLAFLSRQAVEATPTSVAGNSAPKGKSH